MTVYSAAAIYIDTVYLEILWPYYSKVYLDQQEAKVCVKRRERRIDVGCVRRDV